MHLSSITIKGFKSFAERTRLVFSPGVSVVTWRVWNGSFLRF